MSDSTSTHDANASPEHESKIIGRLSRRIRAAKSHVRRSPHGPNFSSAPEEFWDRHLDDLVNDALGLGVARFHGLDNFGNVLGHAFKFSSLAAMGYIQLGGHVNNLALTKWMPTKYRSASKIQALAQLHARSLVLMEEIYALTFMGYPSGAAALSRTLHEVRVTARFLHRFEARLSERYLASHIVELWKHKDDFAPRGSSRRSKQWQRIAQQLDERYDEIIRKHGKSMVIENGWAWPRFAKKRLDSRLPRRIPFARLEDEVGQPFDRERYRHSSRQIHAAHIGSINTLRGNDPGEALLGPRPFNLDKPAVQAAWDAQDTAESLLRSCGRLGSGDDEIFYWLEALDQLSHVLRGLIADAQKTLDYVFEHQDG